jgi:hypothetical protein
VDTGIGSTEPLSALLSHWIGTFSGMTSNSRPRSRSPGPVEGFEGQASHLFSLLRAAVRASRQRQVSAWPSAKVRVQPLLWRVAGKLIQFQTG